MKKVFYCILCMFFLFSSVLFVSCKKTRENDDANDVPPDGPKVTRLAGWKFMQLPSQATDCPGHKPFDDYMMSYMLVGKNHEIIIIDGGRPEDKDYLTQRIIDNGGRVNLWLLTHPHEDHILALDRILRGNLDKISIDKICYNFPSVNDISELASPTNAAYTQDFLDVLNICHIEKQILRKGDIINFSDLKIKVLTEPDPDMTFDFVNSNSLVFRIETTQEDILILGDISKIASDKLLKELPDQIANCEIVQMGHHGNGGPGEEFYKKVNPKTCFWPTPEWLWDCDNGGGKGSFSIENGGLWDTLNTRKWIEDLGVTENYVMKDGFAQVE